VNPANPVIVISARDNVATALEALDCGQALAVGGQVVIVAEAVPRGHKVALREIPPGEAVIKFGSAIGIASARIAPGALVHTHNVASGRGRGDLGRRLPTSGARIAEPPDTEDDAEVPAPEPRSV
jgi:altronate hydrolase